jgi:5-methylcytosine-specific restriction endonuclease McrA
MARVAKTRNGGKWSEAAYWGAVRSALRRKFAFWQPAMKCLNAAKRPSQSDNKRLKSEYQCAECGKWKPRKEVQIDHVEECGSLKCYEDIAPFLKRLTPEDISAFQILCKKCHQIRTNQQRQKRKENK